MGNKVVTITECENCPKKITNEGAESFCPPIGWWSLNLSRRDKGSGWTNSYQVKKMLCPECAEQIYNLLGIIPDKPNI